MAKRPGAGGILIVAVILGLITAYVTWRYVSNIQKKSKENWVQVIVAAVDIPAGAEVTRENIEIKDYPQDRVAPNACVKFEDVEGRMAIERIQAQDQIRSTDLAKKGEAPGIKYAIPSGKRAIAIGVDEVKGVGTMIRPGDSVDIIATLTDPLARMETTQTILQNIPVLAVDKGRTDGSQGGGASTSITIAVPPEEAERLTAADRLGTLRVMLRGAEETVVVNTEGVRASQIFRGRYPEASSSTNEPGATPVIFSPPPLPQRNEIKIYRGTSEQIYQAQ